MVIPASMNQIHGGTQLIRLVLTSISALMIKTLQKALAQLDVFSRLGGSSSRSARRCAPGEVRGKLPVPSSRRTSPHHHRHPAPALPASRSALLPRLLQANAHEDPWARKAGDGKAGSRQLRSAVPFQEQVRVCWELRQPVWR